MENAMNEKLENRLSDIQFERLSAINMRNMLWSELIYDLCDADLSDKAMRMRKKIVVAEIEYWGEKAIKLEAEAMNIVEQLEVK